MLLALTVLVVLTILPGLALASSWLDGLRGLIGEAHTIEADSGLARQEPAAEPDSETRLALVIGNSAYPNAPLKNPVNDAEDLAAKLKGLGFEVTQLLNAGSVVWRQRCASLPASLTARWPSVTSSSAPMLQTHSL
jgi:hypothetical protein